MAHWRDTMRPMRFFGIDARASAPLLFFVMNIELWTFVLAAGTAILFTVLERRGLTLLCRSMLNIVLPFEATL